MDGCLEPQPISARGHGITMDVIPISIPQIDWQSMPEVALRQTDATGVKSGTASAYLTALAAFGDVVATRSLSFGFLLTGEPQTLFQLGVWRRNGQYILGLNLSQVVWTEHLEDWFHLLNEPFWRRTKTLTEIHNKLFLAFSTMGLGNLWHMKRRKDNGDGTFYLEYR